MALFRPEVASTVLEATPPSRQRELCLQLSAQGDKVPDRRQQHRSSFAFKAKLGDFGSMAKYDPLHAYLKRQKGDVCELSFREIENLIGYLLPKGASEPSWWGNIVDGSSARAVQRQAWLGAGFRAQLHHKTDHVAFTRVEALESIAHVEAG